MELTKTQLKQIIKEELALVLAGGLGQGKPAPGKWSKKQEIVLVRFQLGDGIVFDRLDVTCLKTIPECDEMTEEVGPPSRVTEEPGRSVLTIVGPHNPCLDGDSRCDLGLGL